MRRGFPKVSTGVAQSGTAADAQARASLALEHEIRRKSRKGDRAAFCLGVALAAGSASFLVYAVSNSGEFQRSGLVLPRIVSASKMEYIREAEGNPALQDPETTGTLARETGSHKGSVQAPGSGSRAQAELPLFSIRRAFQGFATLEGPGGDIDVVPGVEVPGAGKVLAVKQIAGQWVVETSEGVIRAASR